MVAHEIRARAGFVEGPHSKRIGSCTLVAPGVIATCAHVVNAALGCALDASDPPDAPIRVGFPALGGHTSLAHLCHWAAFDPALREGSDLALLRLEDNPGEALPTAAIAGPDGMVAGQDVMSMTYTSPLPKGEPRIGQITDAGQAFIIVRGADYGEKGMSGTGVWAGAGRAVLLGLFSGVPTKGTQTSGYAIPGAVLKAALDDIGESPTLGEGLFEPYPRRLHDSFGPAALLDARFGVAPYFRDPETESDLETWVNQDTPFLLRLEYGPGGVGKTRRWLEYCHQRQNRGLFGLLMRRAGAEAAAAQFAALAEDHALRVVVVDYAESQSELVAALLARVRDLGHGRTRIILLARNAADWWALLRRRDAATQAMLSGGAVTEIRAAPMSIPQDRKQAAFDAATEVYAARIDAVPKPDRPDIGALKSAIALQMAALSMVMGAAEADLVAAVLERERRFWDLMATDRLPARLIEALAAAVYQVDGVETRKKAEAVFTGKGAFRDLPYQDLQVLFDIYQRLYPGEQFLNPMQPDLIGERLIEDFDG